MNVAAWCSSMVNTANVSKLFSYMKVIIRLLLKACFLIFTLFGNEQFLLLLASLGLSYQRDITKHFILYKLFNQ